MKHSPRIESRKPDAKPEIVDPPEPTAPGRRVEIEVERETITVVRRAQPQKPAEDERKTNQ